jgi:hypothetical protein
MKAKLLNSLLLLTSLLGYLEWGNNQNIFLAHAEWDILKKIVTTPLSVAHPLIIIPMISQFLLLLTLFQKKTSKMITYIAIIGLGLLFGFITLAGLLSLNVKIVGSTLPFLTTALVTINYYRKLKRQPTN